MGRSINLMPRPSRRAYDNDLVKRYGVNQTEITAIGCTRRTEAHRRGRWAILSNAKNRTVSFQRWTGRQYSSACAYYRRRGRDVGGKANGGRIDLTERTVVLDREVEFSAGRSFVHQSAGWLGPTPHPLPALPLTRKP